MYKKAVCNIDSLKLKIKKPTRKYQISGWGCAFAVVFVNTTCTYAAWSH